MRAGSIIVCVSLVLMNFQFPIDAFSNTDGPTFPLEVTIEKYDYAIGERINLTMTNVGDKSIDFLDSSDLQVRDEAWQPVRIPCPSMAQVVITLKAGETRVLHWDQDYFFCSHPGDPTPPNGEQVPTGWYELIAGSGNARYGGEKMPVADTVWIQIGPEGSPPVADAGPDQTVNVSETVHFNGSGSHSSIGTAIPVGDNMMINDVVSLGGVGGGPQVTLDSAGGSYVTWTDTSKDRGGILFDNASNLGPFGSDRKVGEYFSTWSDIALGPDDRIHIAWRHTDIQYSVSTDGGLSFSSPVTINEVDTPSGYPVRIAAGTDESVHIVWASSPDSQVCYRSSSDNGEHWDPSLVIADGIFPDVAVSDDGHAFVTWIGLVEGSANASVLFSRRSPNGSFETPIPVHPIESFRHIDPSIAVGVDGEVMIVWVEQDKDEHRIVYSKSTDNGLNFDTPVVVRAGKPVGPFIRFSNPAVTTFRSKGVAVAWIEYVKPYEPRAEARVSVSLDMGHTFSSYSQVDDYAQSGKRQPAIAGNSKGDLISVWHDGRDCPSEALCGSNIYGVWLEVSSAPLKYDWDFGDGSPHSLEMSPTHTYSLAGVYNVTLTVTDSQGATGSDICVITVLSPNQPPVADAGPNQTVNEGDSVLLNGTGSFDPDGGAENWKSKTNIPSPRAGGASAVLNGEIYYVGGNSLDLIPGPSSVFQKYSPSTDSWSDLPDLPEPRVFLGAAAVNGRIYAIGGYVGNLSTNTTYEFDPSTNTWISKAPMPIPMEAFGTAVVNERIYVVGGSSTFVWCYPCADVFEYNPSTDSWSKKPDLPTGRARLATAVLDNKIYAIGGDAYVAVGAVDVYDPSIEVWTKRANMTTPRSGLSAEVLGGRIYAFGGIISWDLGVDVNEMYDPLSDNWTSKPSMLDLRMDFGSGVVGNCMYGVGGYRGWMGGHPNSTEEYCLDGELVYEWDIDANVDSDGDGNYTNDVDVSGPTPTHVYGDNGNYTVTLKVTDGSGLWDTDTCIITVLNVPPTADASGPYNGFEGTPIHFNGSHTDPGPLDTHTYEWDFSYDGTTFTPDATGNPFQKTWYDDYSGNIALRVTDDDGGWDLDVTAVTVANVPPRAEAGEDMEGFEVSTFTFNGSFYDPGANDTHEYAWDFDYDGISFDVEATGQSVTHTFVDDFDGDIALRVTDDDGGVGIGTAHVLVKNVPPTVTLEVLPIEVDAFLRIAGEKWHDVSIELFEDGSVMANGTLVRYPGSPDDQMLDLSSLQFDYSKKYSATIRYTPEDDPVNGQPNGANPCWIILRFSDGQELWIHHTFNVQHPETYLWEVDLTAAILSHGMTFKATAFDPGADDLTFHWDFGDGTNVTTFYPNVNETYPVEIMEIINHVFPGSGTYTIVLTVVDDDGGVVEKSFILTI